MLSSTDDHREAEGEMCLPVFLNLFLPVPHGRSYSVNQSRQESEARRPGSEKAPRSLGAQHETYSHRGEIVKVQPTHTGLTVHGTSRM